MKHTNPFHNTYPDTPENREMLFQEMLKHDDPYNHGLRREGLPFFLGVTRNDLLAFMTGPDAMDSFTFVIAQWTPWSGLKKVDLPFHEIRWVRHL